jgi:hypothetical protein
MNLIENNKTQKSLKAYFRKIMDEIGFCESIKTHFPLYYDEICELFKRHPENKSKMFGMVDIKLQNHLQFNNRCFFILYENGKLDNISYNLCISGKPKNNLKMVMRSSIKPQIDDFRINNKLVCEFCESKKEPQIDHIIHFEKIYQDFLKVNVEQVPTAFIKNLYYVNSFRDEDKPFETAWVKYHKENATLRVLCRNCNIKREKYK